MQQRHSVEDVLNSQAEAVVVEGHVYQNLDYAERALAAGKHVLLEKPAGVDLSQLERLHKLAEDKGLMLQMAYMWSYNPAVAEMLRLVREGSLGQVFMYRGHIPSRLAGTNSYTESSPPITAACTSRWPGT